VGALGTSSALSMVRGGLKKTDLRFRIFLLLSIRIIRSKIKVCDVGGISK